MQQEGIHFYQIFCSINFIKFPKLITRKLKLERDFLPNMPEYRTLAVGMEESMLFNIPPTNWVCLRDP
jgi:hypothetical protein